MRAFIYLLNGILKPVKTNISLSVLCNLSILYICVFFSILHSFFYLMLFILYISYIFFTFVVLCKNMEINISIQCVYWQFISILVYLEFNRWGR